MEKIDLSTNSRKIQESYDKIVRGDPNISYGVYSVDKNATLVVTETGSGSLEEFVENFTDGQIQFGLARVTVPGSDVAKNLLLGWCPDNAPAKSRLSFATNFAEVSKVLSGYHVQITARDQDDLDVDEFLHRVGAAAGARYSIQSVNVSRPAQKLTPPVTKPIVSRPAPKVDSSKPQSFVPKSTGKPLASKPSLPKPSKPASFSPVKDDIDEWGGEQELEERDFTKNPLEDTPSAYKPTKVNIAELRKQKSDTISSTPKPYKADHNEIDAVTNKETPSLNDRISSYKSNEASSDGRLYSLPKPKVSNSVASRFTSSLDSTPSKAPSFGAKPQFSQANEVKKEKITGGFSRNFAAENGKTPAQIWAEKRGKYKSVSPQPESQEPETQEEEAQDEEAQDEEKEEEQEEEEEEEQEEEEEKQHEQQEEEPRFEPLANRFAALNTSADQKPEDKPKDDFIPRLPVRNLPPPPVRNVVPTAPVPDQEEQDVEKEKVEEDKVEKHEELKEEPIASSPSLPARDEPKSNGASQEKTELVTAIAEYDYEKDEDNEVGFAEGDLIVEIEFVDEDWWSGKNSNTGEIGLFPSSYVVLQKTNLDIANSEETPAAESESKSSSPSATADYDYDKDEDNEIGFAEGDLIVDIEFVDEDWWSGKHSVTNEIGLFPANYVTLNN